MKRFDFLTEAEARVLEPGSTIEMAAEGRITPLAQDTLKAHRVTIIRSSEIEGDLTKLVPAQNPQRIAVGSDHTGVGLKRHLLQHLRSQGRAVNDLGTDSTDAVDYPDIAANVARAVARGEADAGIVIDGAGIGSAIAANKIAGIRAAMCTTPLMARYAREHNGANVITLGATLLRPEEAAEIIDVWMGASMQEPRYIRRLAKIRALEMSK